jgi:hypothetical protein
VVDPTRKHVGKAGQEVEHSEIVGKHVGAEARVTATIAPALDSGAAASCPARRTRRMRTLIRDSALGAFADRREAALSPRPGAQQASFSARSSSPAHRLTSVTDHAMVAPGHCSPGCAGVGFWCLFLSSSRGQPCALSACGQYAAGFGGKLGVSEGCLVIADAAERVDL